VLVPFLARKKPISGPITVQKGPFCKNSTFWLVQNRVKIIANFSDEKPMTKKEKEKETKNKTSHTTYLRTALNV